MILVGGATGSVHSRKICLKFKYWRHFGMIFIGGTENVSLRGIGRNWSKFCQILSNFVKKFEGFDRKRFPQRNMIENSKIGAVLA